MLEFQTLGSPRHGVLWGSLASQPNLIDDKETRAWKVLETWLTPEEKGELSSGVTDGLCSHPSLY